jgi:20S proteasome subunit beta 6
MISNSLYSRRSFPFYSFCVVGGLEREGIVAINLDALSKRLIDTLSFTGCGQLYKFDALGSMEQLSYTCAGAGEKILQSLLDCTVGDPRRVNGSGVERGKSISRPSDGDTTHKLWRYDRESNSFLSPEERHRTCFVNITASEACAIVADAFAAAAERDITIGDSVNIHLLRRSGKQGRIFSRLFRISLSPSGSRNNLNARMYPT